MNDAADLAIMTAFDKALLKLRRDNVAKATFRDIDDSSAFLLSGSLLMGNKNLQSMTVFTGMELTTLGAKALGKAIRKSQIQELHLEDDDGEGVPTSGVRMLYMEAVKSVREITIGFEFRNTDAQRLGKALRANKIVSKLSLDAEHVTAPGARLLADGIRLSRISDLCIRAATPEVCQVLFGEGIQPSATIKHLEVSCDSGDDALSKILPKLQSLQLGTFVDIDTGIPHLCHGLEKATLLTKLEFRIGCMFNDEHLKLLSSTLRGNTTLQMLRIESDAYGVAGLESLIASWKDGSALQELRLLYNKFGPAGIQLLLQATHTHPHLRLLDVSSYHNVTLPGLTAIAKDLHKSKLTTFNVSVSLNIDLTDVEGVRREMKAEKEAGQALVQAMKSNFYLETIDLEDVDISVGAKAEVAFYLKLNRSGRRLLMAHGLESSIWCHVLAKWRADPSLLFYFLREQPTLMSNFKSTAGTKRRFYNTRSDEPRAKRQRTQAPNTFLNDPLLNVSVFVVLAVGVLHAMSLLGQT